ncbi:MAG: helix-turn-helix transcriptional regulator [Bacteroidota bacterium]
MNPFPTVRKLRRDKNIRQAEIAKHLGISQSNYAKLENGKIELTINKLLKISEFLHVHPVEILYPESFPLDKKESIEKLLLHKLEKSYKETVVAKDKLITELKEKSEDYKKLLDDLMKKTIK